MKSGMVGPYKWTNEVTMAQAVQPGIRYLSAASRSSYSKAWSATIGTPWRGFSSMPDTMQRP
jgi:hypothetical protein